MGGQLYINLVEHLPFGLIIWQLDDLEDANTFKLLAVNPVACQILGISVDDLSQPLSSQSKVDPFPAFLKLEPPETYAQIIRSGKTRDLGEIRYRYEHSTQTTIFLAKAFPLPQQQIGVLFEDITERKQAEEALRHLELKLLFHWQHTPLAVIEWDTQFRVVEWNPAAERMFGYSRREAIGQSTTRLLFPPILQNDVQRVWERLIASKTSLSRTIQAMTHTEQRMTCEWHCTPLLDEEQQVIGILSFVQDITDRRRAERELRQFTERLAHSNRELQDFASVASHDLQEPLRKIQMFGHRLHTQYQDVLPEEGRDYLERMQGAAKRMQALIKDLLTLAQIDTQAPFSPVHLTTIVQNVLSDLEIRIQQLAATIEVGDLPTIEADPVQMHQLLQNLISNALKFHRPGIPPQIHIRAQLLVTTPEMPIFAPDQRVCQIQVVDNGIGFDEQHLDRIFTIFQRLHGRSEYEGSGVGLAICRKIVERHGGCITAQSRPGQGAIFTIMLPVQAQNELHT